MYLCMCVCVCVSMYVCVRMYVCMYVCTYVCVSMYVCVCVSMYVCMYVAVHIAGLCVYGRCVHTCALALTTRDNHNHRIIATIIEGQLNNASHLTAFCA